MLEVSHNTQYSHLSLVYLLFLLGHKKFTILYSVSQNCLGIVSYGPSGGGDLKEVHVDEREREREKRRRRRSEGMRERFFFIRKCNKG